MITLPITPQTKYALPGIIVLHSALILAQIAFLEMQLVHSRYSVYFSKGNLVSSIYIFFLLSRSVQNQDCALVWKWGMIMLALSLSAYPGVRQQMDVIGTPLTQQGVFAF